LTSLNLIVVPTRSKLKDLEKSYPKINFSSLHVFPTCIVNGKGAQLYPCNGQKEPVFPG